MGDEVKLQLEVGKWYFDRTGKKHQITSKFKEGDHDYILGYRFIGGICGQYYTDSGRVDLGENEDPIDLVSEAGVRLEVGKFYQTRHGRVMQIKYRKSAENSFSFVGFDTENSFVDYFNKEGISNTSTSLDTQWDIVEEVVFPELPELPITSVEEENQRVCVNSNDHPFVLSVRHGGVLTNVTFVPMGDKLHVVMGGA